MIKIFTWIAGGVFLAASIHLAPGDTSVASRRAAAVHEARSEELPPATTTTTTAVQPEPVATSTTTTSTTTTTVAPVQASPSQPIHNGRPLAPEGQTAEDATVIADDGFGFSVETGQAEVSRLGGTYDVSDLAVLCAEAKPWLCE